MSSAAVAALAQIPHEESYADLLHSGPHWLFELTLEAVSAPLAFAVGWFWRNGLLRHLHRDLHAVHHGLAAAGDPWPSCVGGRPDIASDDVPRRP